MRGLLDVLWQEWKHLQGQIESLNEEPEKIAQGDEACRRLQQIPGVGPLVATAMVSAIGNGAAFHKGREFAAWLGLVPATMVDGRENQAVGNQQTGKSVSAQDVYPRRSGGGVAGQTGANVFRPVDERLGNPSRAQHRHRGRGQQTGMFADWRLVQPNSSCISAADHTCFAN
jgi:hypothetical protein